jgi:hypothetical protein
MPKKLHPFQRELQQRSNEKARIERELKLCQRIYTFAELSDKERKRRFAFLIAEKQFAAQRHNLSDDEEWDSDSSLDVETPIQDSSPQTEKNFSKTFDYVELTFGFIIGVLIGLNFTTVS